MNAIVHSIKCDLSERRAENMNYVAAIFCIIALVVINVFGTESKDINTILSTAIMALVWGGVQRGAKKADADGDSTFTTERKKR